MCPFEAAIDTLARHSAENDLRGFLIFRLLGVNAGVNNDLLSINALSQKLSPALYDLLAYYTLNC
jgi:hypothetical protein